MIPLVDEIVAADKTLSPGYCYSYLQLPILGGEYSINNTTMVPIKEHYGLSGEIHKQIKDLPDGSKVTIKFKE